LNLLKVILPPESEQLEISQFIVKENSIFEALTKQSESIVDLLQERRTALISAALPAKST